jgi:hypothetical protein
VALASAESRLAGVDDVQKAVLVLLLLVELGHGHGVGHHAFLVDEQEKRLVGVQLQTATENREYLKWADFIIVRIARCQNCQ